MPQIHTIAYVKECLRFIPWHTYGFRLDFSFHVDNGGFVKVENKESGVIETHYYSGSTLTHAYEVRLHPASRSQCNTFPLGVFV